MLDIVWGIFNIQGVSIIRGNPAILWLAKDTYSQKVQNSFPTPATSTEGKETNISRRGLLSFDAV